MKIIKIVIIRSNLFFFPSSKTKYRIVFDDRPRISSDAKLYHSLFAVIAMSNGCQMKKNVVSLCHPIHLWNAHVNPPFKYNILAALEFIMKVKRYVCLLRTCTISSLKARQSCRIVRSLAILVRATACLITV